MMRRLNRTATRALLNFMAVLCLVATSSVATASSITPGSDRFITAPGAAVDMSFVLPSVGVIGVEGVPFAPDGADTIIQRIQGINPFEICPILPCLEVIDIELVALSLVSIDPVDLSDLGGPFIGVFADIFFTVNKGGIVLGLPQPDALNPSIGRMEIIHTNALGGTFESCLGNGSDSAGVCSALGVAGGGVYSDAIFTVVGGDPSNPLDVFFSAAAPRLAVSGLLGLWQHGGSGDFQVIEVQDECNFPSCHPVVTVPEPSAALLVGLGMLGLGVRRRANY